jgi:YHS domain-containing protein
MTSQTTHLRPNITVETITITNPNQSSKTLYVYNYKGVHYRVFSTQKHLENFLENIPAPILADFTSETALEAFLINY